MKPEDIWNAQFKNALNEEDPVKRKRNLNFAKQGAASHGMVFDVPANHKHINDVREAFDGTDAKYVKVVGGAQSLQDYLRQAEDSMAARGVPHQRYTR